MEPLNKLKLIKRLKKHTVYVDNCWIYKDNGKQGIHKRIHINYILYSVHRLSAYIYLRLDITNKDIQTNHKRECPNKDCWNPEHIYIGNQQENVQDSIMLGHNKELRKKVHSVCGGQYSISPTTGYRYCQRCKNNSRDKWRVKTNENTTDK